LPIEIESDIQMTRSFTFTAVLDVLITISVLSAALCVIALSGRIWLRGIPAQTSGSEVSSSPTRPVPDVPHPLLGSQLAGDSKARLAIIEYSDFECPYCSDFARSTWPELKRTYVDTGQVLMSFRMLPLPSHPHARSAAISAWCSGRQGRFWEMHDQLFRQHALEDSTGGVLAAQLGLDLRAFQSCLTKEAVTVEHDVALAQSFGINATPSFLIGRLTNNGTVKINTLFVGSQGFSTFKVLLDNLLGT
jgi:protein-disulfide isomerase